MLKIGIECEGIYSGLKTLFVGSPCTNEEFYTAYHSNKVAHIYLGADYTTPTFEFVKYVVDLVNERQPITLELPIEDADEIPLKLVGKVSFMFRIRLKDHHIRNFDAFSKTDQIKVETKDKCYLAPISTFIVNEKNYLDKPIK